MLRPFWNASDATMMWQKERKPLPTSLDAGIPLRHVQEAASHADLRTTMRYDRARGSLDRHVTYIVAAYVVGAAR
jgi:hypothetical protein